LLGAVTGVVWLDATGLAAAMAASKSGGATSLTAGGGGCVPVITFQTTPADTASAATPTKICWFRDNMRNSEARCVPEAGCGLFSKKMMAGAAPASG
jgi:hypothetical protein